MQPIHELLNRIRWDEEFAKGDFEIAYLERGKEDLGRINLTDIEFEQGNKFSFNALCSDRLYHDIPYHRVREVYKDGAIIWKRN